MIVLSLKNYFINPLSRDINPAELVLNYMKIRVFVNHIFLISAVSYLFSLYKAENISVMNYFL